MTGQKGRIIRRFEREARKKLKVGGLTNDFLDAIMFNFKEVREIIGKPGENNEPTQYKCGHSGKPIILDDNALSITAWMEWSESVGVFGNKSECWSCFCKGD